jgi:endonuclease YncB( thermonuclease family)
LIPGIVPRFREASKSIRWLQDGDTIQVLHNTYPERVRLSGIDCPENGQAYGNNTKQAVSALVFGRDVIL